MKTLFHTILIFSLFSRLFTKIPTYINLPEDISHLSQESNPFKQIKNTGVEGVTFDIFWGLVETTPQSYDFSLYLHLLQNIKSNNLKAQVILSFHAAKFDDKFIPLPLFVQIAAEEHKLYSKNSNNDALPTYLSIFADNEKVLPTKTNHKRTPLEAYQEFAQAFKSIVLFQFGDIITNVIIGSGPNGQLKFTNERFNFSDYCSPGDYQVFDSYAQQSAQEYKVKVITNNDVCHNNLTTNDCGWMGISKNLCEQRGCCWVPNSGIWCKQKQYPDQEDFINWYHNALVSHGEILMKKIREVLKNQKLSIKIPSIHWRINKENREPERRAGLIDQREDESYQDFFKIASENEFSIIFDGLGLAQRHDSCFSEPSNLINLFIKYQNEYNVEVIGENVFDLNDIIYWDYIRTQSQGFSGLNLLRMNVKGNDVQNLNIITAIVKTTDDYSAPQLEIEQSEEDEESNEDLKQQQNTKTKKLIRKIVILEILCAEDCDKKKLEI